MRRRDCIVLFLPGCVVKVNAHRLSDWLTCDTICCAEYHSLTVVFAPNRILSRWLLSIDIDVGHSSLTNAMVPNHNTLESNPIRDKLSWQA